MNGQIHRQLNNRKSIIEELLKKLRDADSSPLSRLFVFTRPTTEHRRTSHHLLNRWWFGKEGIDWSNRSSRNAMSNVSHVRVFFSSMLLLWSSSIAEVLSIDRTSLRWKSNGMIRREQNHPSQSIRSRCREESVVNLSFSIGRTSDGCHRSIPTWTRWCDRRDSRTIRDEENREEIFHRVLDWAILPLNWHRMKRTSDRSLMMKDRFSPRPAKKIEKRFVPSSNFFNSIDSEEESLENCFLDVCQQHWEKKRSLIFSIDRKEDWSIHAAIPSIQLHSPSIKTFVDMINQESFKELLLLPGLSSVVQLEILVIIAQTLLPILHKIKQLTIKEVQEHISISFIAHWRSTSQKRMGISSPTKFP